MEIIGKKVDPVRLFVRRLGMLLLAAVVLSLFSATIGVYKKERDSRALRDQAQMQVADLEGQQEHLEEEISRLKTPRGQEETLRERYQMGKEGEGMVIIVEPPTVPVVASSSKLRKLIHTFFPFW